MRIKFFEISNYRKLHSARIDLDSQQTLFVGANNSGKTSAIVAIRQFLKERKGFNTKDITASNWKQLEEMALGWTKSCEKETPNYVAFRRLLPALDVWISVKDHELHHVAHLIPSLDWDGEHLGVRIQLEANSFENLVVDYKQAKARSDKLTENFKSDDEKLPNEFSLWPNSLQDFLDRRFPLKLQSYLLDPSKLKSPDSEQRAQPQALSSNALPLKKDPFSGLIQIKEISAQRGFSDASDTSRSDVEDSSNRTPLSASKLSSQLKSYYNRHLNPDKNPTDQDVEALVALHKARSTFDQRLNQGFASAKTKLEKLGYPGLTNPKLIFSTDFQPTDGLNHPSAVQYDIGEGNETIRLPEDYNGLGFQNLISIVFQLMRFRDEWMRVGKYSEPDEHQNNSAIEPLQIVLIEEPEAHLHAQVQRVFIRKAYDVLRAHEDLDEDSRFHTQLIVSSHSGHVAHEIDFRHLRLFKRLPAKDTNVPTSVVVNLSTLFGNETNTKRFVQRYLKSVHCDIIFADGVILIEGAAERILLPHFIHRHYCELSSRYISMIEIGGSHAHLFRPLIEILSIPTLIITDIDAVDPQNKKKSVRPEIGKKYETINRVLQKWIPKCTAIDELLNEVAVPVKEGTGHGHLAVVYQRSVDIVFPCGTPRKTIVPSTFEDSLALANLSLISNLKGTPLTNAFAKIIVEGQDAEEIANGLFERLKKRAPKAAFALDILSSESFQEFQLPEYIDKGLAWLESKLS